ncbi:MAG: J domain-containing protein [Syntrophobacteraceae bacterium]
MPPAVILEADFRVLGLEPGSKPSEVKRAYRTLAKRWHPDRHHSKPYETRALAEAKFREIDEAYRRISQNWEKYSQPGQDTGAGEPAAHTPKSRVRPPRKSNYAHETDIRTTLRKAAFPAALIIVAVYAMIQLFSTLSTPWPHTETPGEVLTQPAIPDAPQPPEEKLSPGLHPEPADLPPPPLLQSQPQPPSGFFTIGSSAAEVLRVQGTPSDTQGQKWIYGVSEIQFRQGKVWGFNNIDGLLKVRMQPRNNEEREPLLHITIGSSEDDVLLVQGTPNRVEGDRWFYGFSELRFKDGRLKEYDNFFGNLKIRLLSSVSYSGDPSAAFFTIGSTSDEVLALHGTPTSVRGNRWSYGFAGVSFREGKVHSVSNSDGSLRFLFPEALRGQPVQ